MDCEQFGNMLDNYENLSKEEHLKLVEHTANCAECRAELEFMNAILKVTKNLPEIMPNKDFIENLNKRIDRECTKAHRFIAIDWKRYGSVAACLLLAVVVGVNGKMLVSRMSDDGSGVIDKTVITSELTETPKYETAVNEIEENELPISIAQADEQAKKDNAVKKNDTDAKSMVIDSSVYNQTVPFNVSTPIPTAAPDKSNDTDVTVAPKNTATPVPSTAPYTIEKNKYRMPHENSTEQVVAASETEVEKSNGFSLSSDSENTVALGGTSENKVVDKEIESAIPASTVVIHSENEEKVRALIADYIVGTYGSYYMTTENNLNHMFSAFDFAGIEYEKYIGGSSDKISFRLVVLP